MRWIIFLLWILLGISYWFAKNECCTGAASNEALSERVVPPVDNVPVKKLTPVSFACKSDKANFEAGWEKFRDSIVNNLKDGQLLQIKGFEFRDESGDEIGALAVARANYVRRQFQLPENKIRMSTGIRSSKCLESQLNNLVAFKFMRNSATVQETDNGTLIYFPSNSTDKITDADIEAYLQEVAQTLKTSRKRVKLTGHTDNTGDSAANYQLGQARANSIKSYLMNKGVPANKIFASSKGELSPIADNASAAGRQKNRRTEVQIIN